MSDPCSNSAQVASNPQLQSACACKKASDSLVSLTNDYETALEKYTTDMATYQKALQAQQTWNANKQVQINTLNAERRDGSCAAAGDCGSSNCNSGWTSDGSIHGNTDNCNICFLRICAKTGCKVSCTRTANQTNSDLQPWLDSNPQPTVPVQPQQPNAPSGFNIQCCTQLFTGVDATNVNFSNIQQQCNQTIQKQISSATAPVTPPPATPPATVPVTPPPATPPATVPVTPPVTAPPTNQLGSLSTNAQKGLLVAGIVGVCVLLLSSLLLLLLSFDLE